MTGEWGGVTSQWTTTGLHSSGGRGWSEWEEQGVGSEAANWGPFAWAEVDRKRMEVRPFLTWSLKEEEAGELAQQLHYPMFF